ncbi:DUF1851 domain-containing protein [Pseudomonas putida]|nr:DUF1851 domain-containing protein [Pseudomonas putida]
MDKIFARFIEKVGPPHDRQEVPFSSIERYTGRLPRLLLEYWKEHGWCGYGDGIFWIVNPQEFEPVISSWLENTKYSNIDTYHLIGRSAFGDLYLWGERTGASLEICSILSRSVTRTSIFTGDQLEKGFPTFLLSIDYDTNDYGELFKPAKKKLGTLRHDEMYGFVPALMLGGPSQVEHLEKVKAVEHLLFLSQLTELEPYSFSDF